MAYVKLDNWDIKRIEDNMSDIQSLLLVVDDLIASYTGCAYEEGYHDGYNDGVVDAL